MKKIVEESLFEYMSYEKTKKLEYPIMERIKGLIAEYDHTPINVYLSYSQYDKPEKYIGEVIVYVTPYTETFKKSKEETLKRNKEYDKLLKKQKAEDITSMSEPEATTDLRMNIYVRYKNDEVFAIDLNKPRIWSPERLDIKFDQEGVEKIEKLVEILAPYSDTPEMKIQDILIKFEKEYAVQVMAESLVNEAVLKDEKETGLKVSDVDPKEFLVGIAVEKEHSSNLAVCKTIAMQHLAENPKYYSEGMKKGIFDEPAAINIYKKYFIDKKEPEESELAI